VQSGPLQNARLFESVESRARELAKSLEDLRTTQDRLVQTQKLASLGQLTAGIAHEIKNPLNFVNNFSGVSIEPICARLMRCRPHEADRRFRPPRRKGAPNKVTAERQAAIAASGEAPLDYMIRVMRDQSAAVERRDEMAKAAAP
jgi:signal transduction histidine kinase